MKVSKLFFCFLAFLLSGFLAVESSAATIINHPFPRKANYFLHWTLSESQARELAKWDLVILDMETQVGSPLLLQKMREWNPDIVMLVYITPQEIIKTASQSSSRLRRKLIAEIEDEWYVVDASGTRLGWWPGTTLLNVTDPAFRAYLEEFVSDELLGTGLWDGVFYDNAWSDVSWAVGDTVDLNRDGRADTDMDERWRAGMKALYTETRERTNNDYVLVGNGNSRAYKEQLNGALIENFLPHAWTPTMQTYALNHTTPHKPAINIINANTANTGRQNYRHMRFGLTSALLENGFYSYSYGDQDQGQLWWFDEYNSNLGQPISGSLASNGGQNYSADLWRRSFENGIAVVNSTNNRGMVSLDGEYERLRGTQDPVVNDGRIVTEIELGAYDGQVLLKTFESLKGVLFTNGSFVRFFRPDGSRVRNGFFAFNNAYKGGDQIAIRDMNADGIDDLLVVKGNKIQAWRSDGQPFFTLYPFGAQFIDEIKVAIGDVNEDRRTEIIVAPGFGAEALPVKVYTIDGIDVREDDWYPFGKTYKGGYSVAIGDVDFDPFGELIIGAGSGNEPRVFVYSHNFDLQSSWLAFDRTSRGGVNVATGRLAGARIGQIVAAPGPGAKPYIRVFDSLGKPQDKQFLAYSTFNFPGIDVRVVDIDFDGKEDIVGMSQD